MTTKLTPEEKTYRKEARKRQRQHEKALKRYQEERDQTHIAEMTLTIEWHKSRTWGNNPRLTARVQTTEAEREKGKHWTSSAVFTCSGCGYDKESTVIAQAFNFYLLYKLHAISPERRKDKPYGVNFWKDNIEEIEHAYYDGGIGTDCYFDIAEFIGGKFEKIASGSTFDVYKYTDKER